MNITQWEVGGRRGGASDSGSSSSVGDGSRTGLVLSLEPHSQSAARSQKLFNVLPTCRGTTRVALVCKRDSLGPY